MIALRCHHSEVVIDYIAIITNNRGPNILYGHSFVPKHINVTNNHFKIGALKWILFLNRTSSFLPAGLLELVCMS